mmetsp:Transcript_18369/g.55407  ORF Transcript_18369/g.55407 Transcript_18369/m.55407 type:complete len:326 (+) Transcript_18369:129-1106(+)
MALHDGFLEQGTNQEVDGDEAQDPEAELARHGRAGKLGAPGLAVVDGLVGQVEEAREHIRPAEEQKHEEREACQEQGEQHEVLVPREPEEVAEGEHDCRPELLEGVNEEHGGGLPVPAQLPPFSDSNQVHREGLEVRVSFHARHGRFHEDHVQDPHADHRGARVHRKERGGRPVTHELPCGHCLADGPGEAQETHEVLQVPRRHGLANAVPVSLELEVRVQQPIVHAVLVAREGCRQRGTAFAEEVHHGCNGWSVGREGCHHCGRGGVAQGQPHVRRPEGAGVVAAVSHHGADQALRHEALHHADLARWRHARKDPDARQQLPSQ